MLANKMLIYFKSTKLDTYVMHTFVKGLDENLILKK